MQSFLDKVAEWVLEKHTTELDRICLVTPNRRAGLFLKKYFSKRVIKSMWAPDVLSMEDFISQITGFTIQEPVSLLLDFYQVYQQEEQQNAEPLEEFLKWAPMLLKDFNDIDAHLPEPSKVFENVLDVKRIEAWNPDGNPLTEFQQKYLKFFGKFQNWHTHFSHSTCQKKTTYQGLAYRQAANLLSEDTIPDLPWQKVYFIGFNALNQAEETIMQSLIKKNKAGVIWDTDKYYLDNRNHEAGMFLRKYRSRWASNEFTFVGDYFSIHKKNINIYGIAQNVNQAKLAANILNTLSPDDIADQNTAVVLANEDLLLPMLNSIPEKIGKVNITMGYPVRKTTVYGLFDAVFQMHLTTLRMKSARSGGLSAFYFKDLVRFFRHPGISVLMQQHGSQQTTEDFINKIFDSKKTFIYFSTMARLWGNDDEFTAMFSHWFEGFAKDPITMVPALKKLSADLDNAFRYQSDLNQLPMESSPWFTDFESLYSINMVLRKLELFMEQQEELNDLRILFMLFQAMAKETKLVLSGEPLAGLQIMGMLETRNLDFKNLIILSANEDILPAAKSNTSFIPFDVKAYFGMPVYKEKDAIYAYHFYRLLQRAENVHIIYNTQTQSIGSSEKSRYITQLQMEMPAWNPNISITENIVPLPSARDNADHQIMIPKTNSILQSIMGINEKGFSPTTLIHYIRCSLLFYFRHVAGIKEAIAPEETIQANTLGTVVHEVLEALYEEQGLTGKILKPAHIDIMLTRIDEVTATKFDEIYKGGDISSGKNLLLARVAARYVKNFLLSEKELLQKLELRNGNLTYIKAEEQLIVTIPMPISNEVVDIKFRGFADRIDLLEDTIRIIDYKTGKVDNDELKFKEWPDIIEDVKLGKSFQLMMYAMLYSRKHGMPARLSPGIISFRNLASGMLALSHPNGSVYTDLDAIESFEIQLQKLMQQIFDPQTQFTRTTDEKNCVNCDFRIVCNR